ncbi:MAG: hypothetical protein NTZ05_12415 [Chloroflexi bacterium]|nr:hypothetical protein [Chloroflexota bacterium]
MARTRRPVRRNPDLRTAVPALALGGFAVGTYLLWPEIKRIFTGSAAPSPVLPVPATPASGGGTSGAGGSTGGGTGSTGDGTGSTGGGAATPPAATPPPAVTPVDPTMVKGSSARRNAIWQAYSELLYRDADSASLDAFDTSGKTIAAIRGEIGASEEAQWVRQIRDIFVQELGRDPGAAPVDREGIRWGVDSLHRGASWADLRALVRQTPEYKQKHPQAAQQPPAATPPPVAQPEPAPAPAVTPEVSVQGLSLNAATLNGVWQAQPLQSLIAELSLFNPTRVALTYNVLLIWKSATDGSKLAQGTITVGPGEPRKLTLTLTAPGSPGVYAAYLGISAGGVTLADNRQPERGAWNIAVPAPAAAAPTPSAPSYSPVRSTDGGPAIWGERLVTATPPGGSVAVNYAMFQPLALGGRPTLGNVLRAALGLPGIQAAGGINLDGSARGVTSSPLPEAWYELLPGVHFSLAQLGSALNADVYTAISQVTAGISRVMTPAEKVAYIPGYGQEVTGGSA